MRRAVYLLNAYITGTSNQRQGAWAHAIQFYNVKFSLFLLNVNDDVLKYWKHPSPRGLFLIVLVNESNVRYEVGNYLKS